MDIGKNIREAREKQSLKVSEVARRSELTISGVTSIETGRVSNPTIDTLVRIARALGVEPAELLKEAPDPKVITLPSTPFTNLSIEELDERLKNAGSAAEVDRLLRALEQETRDLEEFIPRQVTPRVDRARDRARLYAAAAMRRWVQLADDRREPESNRFKSVVEVASELGGRYEEFIPDAESSTEEERANTA
jgi:transcriptional regulator with XRE-family HTH domain